MTIEEIKDLEKKIAELIEESVKKRDADAVAKLTKALAKLVKARTF